MKSSSQPQGHRLEATFPPKCSSRCGGIWLVGEIADVHRASGGTYGYQGVTAELRCGQDIVVGHNTAGKIMGELGIKGLPTRRLPKRARMAQVTSLDLVRPSSDGTAPISSG
jgi:putative transposase